MRRIAWNRYAMAEMPKPSDAGIPAAGSEAAAGSSVVALRRPLVIPAGAGPRRLPAANVAAADEPIGDLPPIIEPEWEDVTPPGTAATSGGPPREARPAAP